MNKYFKLTIIIGIIALNSKIFSTDFTKDLLPSEHSQKTHLWATNIPFIVGFASCGVEQAQKNNQNIVAGGFIGAFAGLTLKTLVEQGGKITAYQLGVSPRIGSLTSIITLATATLTALRSNSFLSYYNNPTLMGYPMTLSSLKTYAAGFAIIVGIAEIFAELDISTCSLIANRFASQIGLDPEITGKTIALSRLFNYIYLSHSLLQSIEKKNCYTGTSIDNISEILKILFIKHQFNLPVLLSTAIVGTLFYKLSNKQLNQEIT